MIQSVRKISVKISVLISVISAVLLLHAVDAHAGLIVQRPLYVGLTDGLVGYWSFDASDMAGERAFDRSGNSNTGTLTNGPVRRAGRIGQALESDPVRGRSPLATADAPLAHRTSNGVDVDKPLDRGQVLAILVLLTPPTQRLWLFGGVF